MKRMKSRLKTKRRQLTNARLHRILKIHKRRKQLVSSRNRIGFRQFGGW